MKKELEILATGVSSSSQGKGHEQGGGVGRIGDSAKEGGETGDLKGRGGCRGKKGRGRSLLAICSYGW